MKPRGFTSSVMWNFSVPTRNSPLKKKTANVSTNIPSPSDSKNTRLIWIVVAVFALQIAVWVSWITFAAQHKVAEVPLATAR
jgi:hypothetical protein